MSLRPAYSRPSPGRTDASGVPSNCTVSSPFGVAKSSTLCSARRTSRLDARARLFQLSRSSSPAPAARCSRVCRDCVEQSCTVDRQRASPGYHYLFGHSAVRAAVSAAFAVFPVLTGARSRSDALRLDMSAGSSMVSEVPGPCAAALFSGVAVQTASLLELANRTAGLGRTPGWRKSFPGLPITLSLASKAAMKPGKAYAWHLDVVSVREART